MKLGILSEWYDPEVGSPAVVGTVARALAADGHDVQVLTGYPNYPSGRVYPGYKLRPTMKEMLRGVSVRRVWLYPSHDASLPRRCLTYLSFVLSATLWGIWHLRKVDVLLVFCSPVTVGIPGVILRHVFGVPLVLFVQDIWPETVWASGLAGAERRGPIRRVLQQVSDAIYRSADRVAVITPGAGEVLAKRGIRSERTDVVYNWVDEAVYRPSLAESPRRSPFVIMYAGSVGHVQALDVAIRALALLPDELDIHLHIVGDGVARPELSAVAREMHVADRVVFFGALPQADAARMMFLAHVQLVSLRDLPLFHYTLPSKIQATMASGLPIVGMVAGDPAALIVRAGAGVVAPPGDVEALAAAFEHVHRLPSAELALMGQRGRAFYVRELSQEVGVSRLSESLQRAQSPRPRVGAIHV